VRGCFHSSLTLVSRSEPVGLRGLEPRTSTLSVSRSNHLSYKPVIRGLSPSAFSIYIIETRITTVRHGTPRGRGTQRSRKEVIQPHLPVRLPCYDLAPVTSITLGGSLLAVRPPTLGTPGFHGLTGGVYKARERIHRAIADARLLAIPASRSRVADSNPN
jgi:hypothetical protein